MLAEHVMESVPRLRRTLKGMTDALLSQAQVLGIGIDEPGNEAAKMMEAVIGFVTKYQEFIDDSLTSTAEGDVSFALFVSPFCVLHGGPRH